MAQCIVIQEQIGEVCQVAQASRDGSRQIIGIQAKERETVVVPQFIWDCPVQSVVIRKKFCEIKASKLRRKTATQLSIVYEESFCGCVGQLALAMMA